MKETAHEFDSNVIEILIKMKKLHAELKPFINIFEKDLWDNLDERNVIMDKVFRNLFIKVSFLEV